MQPRAYRWLWGGWRDPATVTVPRGHLIDLHRLLSQVPPALLASMQQTLTTHGRKFQISLDDDDDEIEAILRGARAHALSIEKHD